VILKTVLIAIALLLLAAFLYVRLSPIDASAVNLDPDTVEKPSFPGHILVRPEGDIEPKTYPMPPEALAARIEAIILATPRTDRLTGTLSEGVTTYITRSALWGFPDIATVKVVATEGGSTVHIFSRLRFGAMDMGVNRARVETWLDQL
jgi:uncharacterized protein (DUF1499 family)